MTQLTHLTLRQEGRLTDSALASIARLHRLKHLDLTSHVSTVRYGWMRFSPEALNQLSALEELEGLVLPGHTIEGPGFAFPRLRSLRVCGSRVDDALASAVTECPGLERLTLDRTLVTDAGLQQIATLRDLRYLSIRNGNITDVGFGQLVSASSIEHIKLQSLPLTDAVINQLARIETLTQIELSLTDQFNIASLQQLSGLSRLRKLSLWIPSHDLFGGSCISSTESRQREMEAVEAVRPGIDALHNRLPNTRITVGTGGQILEQWTN